RVPLSFWHTTPLLFVAFQGSWFAGDLWPLLYLDRTLPRIRRRERSTTDDLIGKGGVTPREHEIVQLICQGKSNNEIADVLFISVQTVKTHTYRIYRKLGVRNRVQLTNLFLGDKIP
ncbi:MAG: response regulator transcription factor, partial [Holophagae bacterium]|nr:response regulator transcription factor [Holophagae bacterium]